MTLSMNGKASGPFGAYIRELWKSPAAGHDMADDRIFESKSAHLTVIKP